MVSSAIACRITTWRYLHRAIRLECREDDRNGRVLKRWVPALTALRSRPCIGIMGAGTVHIVNHCGMQPTVALVEGHVHHIPGLEHQIADHPFFTVSITVEYEGALAGPDEQDHFPWIGRFCIYCHRLPHSRGLRNMINIIILYNGLGFSAKWNFGNFIRK